MAQSGRETMEHLSVELLAGPLRLIADKNEKSRGELTRFLTKAVSTGEGRRALAGELGCPEKGPLFFGVSSSSLPGRCSDRDGERALSERKRVGFSARLRLCAPDTCIAYASPSFPHPSFACSMFFFLICPFCLAH